MKRKYSQISKKALFLDRDGVINVEKNYVHTIKEFEFKEGIFDLCRAATINRMKLVIVTNQAGIGRGLYSEEAFWKLTSWMEEQFTKQYAPIEKVYHCPFHPEFGIGKYRQDSMDRKPNPGMLLRARDELGIDLANSVMIGDNESDMLAAAAAAIGKKILLARNGVGSKADTACQSLAEIQALLFP
jgi:D-glycero-D-manno-heptose 1,7-bisphosphate phosphatase